MGIWENKMEKRELSLIFKKATLPFKEKKEILLQKEKLKKEIGKNFDFPVFATEYAAKHKKQNSIRKTGYSQIISRGKKRIKKY